MERIFFHDMGSLYDPVQVNRLYQDLFHEFCLCQVQMFMSSVHRRWL